MKTKLRILAVFLALASASAANALTESESGWQAAAKGEWKKSVALFSKACDKNEGAGCYWLARSYDSGDGKSIHSDHDKAAQLYGKACDIGDARGCFELGLLYKLGQGVGRDYAKEFEYNVKACEKGKKQQNKVYDTAVAAAIGCYAAGSQYDDQEKTRHLAPAYFKKACDLDDESPACDRL